MAVDGAVGVELDIGKASVVQNVGPKPIAVFIKRVDVEPVVKGGLRFQRNSNVKPIRGPDSFSGGGRVWRLVNPWRGRCQ